MLLSCKDLDIRYGGVRAVRDVSIDVKQGEIICLIGSNGAGKSTILRAISGLIKPYSGEIWFKGDRIDGLPPQKIVRRGIAHVPEGRQVFPWLTVSDNLKTGAYLRKDKKEIKRDLEMIYQRFPILEERKGQKGARLSGGEQMMLAIGRALMAKPTLLLMDAPTQGLAPLVIQEIERIVRDINEKVGVSILLVDQNARLALRLASRGYVLEVGQVAFEGDSEMLATTDRVKKSYLGVT